jgi:excinuclease ABC subunit A
VTVRCDACDGRRFQNRVLTVRYRGKNIGDVLGLTVADASAFFAEQPKIVRRLQPLVETGLGYVTLGQPTATLSGGEAQRLKLASFIDARAAPGGFGGPQGPPPQRRSSNHSHAHGTLFLFDEPTTGLHASDIERLLKTLRRLILLGHSVLAIEHNLQFLAASDWIVDLGPGGGDRGGRLVAEGPPAEIRRVPASLTGRFLAELAPEPSPEPRETRGATSTDLR